MISLIALAAITVALGVAHKRAANAQGSEEAAVNDALMKSAVSFEKNDLPMASQVWVNVMDNGKPRHVDGGGLGTAVLEKRDGQWRIVHWHSSAPRRAPAATPSPAAKP